VVSVTSSPLPLSDPDGLLVVVDGTPDAVEAEELSAVVSGLSLTAVVDELCSVVLLVDSSLAVFSLDELASSSSFFSIFFSASTSLE
jgi:hypothetical protein